MGDAAETVNGTAIALAGNAVLIRGASGSGKSDLALRCLALAPTALTMGPAMLVSDDYVTVTRRDDKLVAEPPATIRGKLEVRGLGIVTVPFLESAALVLVADLADGEPIERFPDPPPTTELAGVKLPLLRIAAFEASAAAKLLMALAGHCKRSASGG